MNHLQATEHETRAKDLIAEFDSVAIPAEIGAYTGEPAGSQTTVLVSTGAKPAKLDIRISDAIRWRVPRFEHTHELALKTPVAEVVELFALCFAGRCHEVGQLIAAATAGKEATP